MSLYAKGEKVIRNLYARWWNSCFTKKWGYQRSTTGWKYLLIWLNSVLRIIDIVLYFLIKLVWFISRHYSLFKIENVFFLFFYLNFFDIYRGCVRLQKKKWKSSFFKIKKKKSLSLFFDTSKIFIHRLSCGKRSGFWLSS